MEGLECKWIEMKEEERKKKVNDIMGATEGNVMEKKEDEEKKERKEA